tara:strand:- start:318 stop:530 length:213 start_codon:yes stop_codon:yes gene_type:complete
MKESTLLEMKNKIEAMGRVIQMLLDEMNNIRTLSIGTLETIKHMPDYEQALGKLKEKTKDKDGVVEQDIK